MKLKLKKIIMTIASTMAAAAMMLATMPSAQVSAASVIHDTNKVALYSREGDRQYYDSHSYTNYIKVAKDISFGKVYLNHLNKDGVWEKKEAKYLTSLDNNYSIYEASYGEAFTYPDCYVSCEANGDTYVDDNNGKYYTAQNLGAAPLCVLRSNCNYPCSYFDISVDLKNLAYQKDVKVRYTVDNWKTYKEAPLSYKETQNDGTELWGTNIDISKASEDSFQYAVSYTVNGTTYWDNNFGRNYDLNFHHHF